METVLEDIKGALEELAEAKGKQLTREQFIVIRHALKEAEKALME